MKARWEIWVYKTSNTNLSQERLARHKYRDLVIRFALCCQAQFHFTLKNAIQILTHFNKGLGSNLVMHWPDLMAVFQQRIWVNWRAYRFREWKMPEGHEGWGGHLPGAQADMRWGGVTKEGSERLLEDYILGNIGNEWVLIKPREVLFGCILAPWFKQNKTLWQGKRSGDWQTSVHHKHFKHSASG